MGNWGRFGLYIFRRVLDFMHYNMTEIVVRFHNPMVISGLSVSGGRKLPIALLFLVFPFINLVSRAFKNRTAIKVGILYFLFALFLVDLKLKLC